MVPDRLRVLRFAGLLRVILFTDRLRVLLLTNRLRVLLCIGRLRVLVYIDRLWVLLDWPQVSLCNDRVKIFGQVGNGAVGVGGVACPMARVPTLRNR